MSDDRTCISSDSYSTRSGRRSARWRARSSTNILPASAWLRTDLLQDYAKALDAAIAAPKRARFEEARRQVRPKKAIDFGKILSFDLARKKQIMATIRDHAERTNEMTIAARNRKIEDEGDLDMLPRSMPAPGPDRRRRQSEGLGRVRCVRPKSFSRNWASPTRPTSSWKRSRTASASRWNTGASPSCEAQIIGYKDRAVVYVSPGRLRHRRRFSTGHELGHWHHHRGQSFVCRSSDIGKPFDEKSKDAERQADAYSGDLILPPFMVRPRLERLGEISLDGIAELAWQFKASVTATAMLSSVATSRGK